MRNSPPVRHELPVRESVRENLRHAQPPTKVHRQSPGVRWPWRVFFGVTYFLPGTAGTNRNIACKSLSILKKTVPGMYRGQRFSYRGQRGQMTASIPVFAHFRDFHSDAAGSGGWPSLPGRAMECKAGMHHSGNVRVRGAPRAWPPTPAVAGAGAPVKRAVPSAKEAPPPPPPRARAGLHTSRAKMAGVM